MDSLLPCPFCAVVPPESAASGKAVITHPYNTCPLRGKMFFVTDWNHRAGTREAPAPGGEAPQDSTRTGKGREG